MVTLGSVCGFATFYEMQPRHPGGAARHLPDAVVRLPPRPARPERLLGDGEPLPVDEAPHRLPHRARRHPRRPRRVRDLALPRPRLEHGPLRGRDVRPRDAARQGAPRHRSRRRRPRQLPGGVREAPAAPGPRAALRGARAATLVLVADELQPHVARRRVVRSPPRAAPPAAALRCCRRRWRRRTAGWWPTTPSAATSDFGMVSFGFTRRRPRRRRRSCWPEPRAPNHLSLVVAPGGELRYVATDASGALPHRAPSFPGQPVDTGWPALGLTIDRFLPAAAVVRTVTAGDAAGQGGEAPRRGARAPRGARAAAPSRSGCSGASSARSRLRRPLGARVAGARPRRAALQGHAAAVQQRVATPARAWPRPTRARCGSRTPSGGPSRPSSR